MNRPQTTVGRCGTILAAAVTLSLCGCHKPPPPRNGSAKLSWTAPTQNSDGSKIADLAGYYIYYGTNPYALNQTVKVGDPGTTTYTLGSLQSGTTYYFSVVAYTATGIKGSASATVSTAVP
jgi:hypothetical protein